MNTKKYLTSLAFAALLIVSCSRAIDPDPVPSPQPVVEANAVNDFVWKAMNSWYYWQPNVCFN